MEKETHIVCELCWWVTRVSSHSLAIWYKYNSTEVASNKSSLSLKIILQNTQTLHLFTMLIKKESIYKSN